MKVLVIGNGFDKAPELKTSYKDFLDFIKQQMWKKYDVGVDDNGIDISKQFEDIQQNNAFIKYLLSYSREIDLWVDFESEMRRITVCIYDALKKIPDSHDNEISSQEIFSEYEVKCLVLFGFLSNRILDRHYNYIIEPSIQNYTESIGK
jgi:hypothetical protein